MDLDNKRKYFLLAFFVFIAFTYSYGLLEFSMNKTDAHVDIANAGVAKCGCQKCHTIELNGCDGCHNSKQGTKSNESPSSEEPHEDESSIPENSSGPQEPQSSPVETPGSDPSQPNNDGPQKSGILPDKSKNQQGYDQSHK